jgi:hypothetical protein
MRKLRHEKAIHFREVNSLDSPQWFQFAMSIKLFSLGVWRIRIQIKSFVVIRLAHGDILLEFLITYVSERKSSAFFEPGSLLYRECGNKLTTSPISVSEADRSLFLFRRMQEKLSPAVKNPLSFGFRHIVIHFQIEETDIPTSSVKVLSYSSSIEVGVLIVLSGKIRRYGYDG